MNDESVATALDDLLAAARRLRELPKVHPTPPHGDGDREETDRAPD